MSYSYGFKVKRHLLNRYRTNYSLVLMVSGSYLLLLLSEVVSVEVELMLAKEVGLILRIRSIKLR